MTQAGVLLTPANAEEAVESALSHQPGLPADDPYDSCPVMLPLVQLIEKAQQLPSDVQVSLMSCHQQLHDVFNHVMAQLCLYGEPLHCIM
jgi:hypothetical protein